MQLLDKLAGPAPSEEQPENSTVEQEELAAARKLFRCSGLLFHGIVKRQLVVLEQMGSCFSMLPSWHGRLAINASPAGEDEVLWLGFKSN